MDPNQDYLIDFTENVFFENNRLINPPSQIVKLSEILFVNIKSYLNHLKRDEYKYLDCLTFKLHNLLLAYTSIKHLVYSRDKNYYLKKYSCKENRHFWEKKIIIDVTDALEKSWYIRQIIGRRRQFHMQGFRTTVTILPWLSEKFEDIHLGSIQLSENIDQIELRDRKERCVKRKNGNKILVIDKPKKFFRDSQHFRIPQMRVQLNRIYKFYKKQDLRGFLPYSVAAKNHKLVTEFLYPYRDTGRIELIERPKGYLFKIKDRWIRRIFNDGTFLHGGRLYAFWQQIPRDLRKYLIINGSRIAELDFSGCQIRMLYHMMLKKDFIGACPYTIWRYQRDLMKKAAIITINAETMGSAAGALKKAAETDLRLPINFKTALQYIGKFSKKHEGIKDFFNSGAGVILMRIESEIIVRIILALMKKGICVLTIHDSCIFPIQYRSQVHDAMISEYRYVLGFDPVVKLE